MKEYKEGTSHPLKIKLEELKKVKTKSEVETFGMMDHIWKKDTHYHVIVREQES